MANSSGPSAQKPARKFELLDVHPLEVAQQLALMEHDLCRNIQRSDIEVRKQNPPVRNNSDSVQPSIRFSNDLASWVAESVLDPEDTPRRAAVIEHFIAIAHSSRGMNNIASMTAIVSALKSPPIHRLAESWKLVTTENFSLLSSCALTCNPSNNFNYLWRALACLEPPGVPFLGNFLTLQVPDEYSNSLIIGGYERWQLTPYQFEVDEDLQAYIKEIFGNMNDGNRDRYDHFSKLSLEREPGKREEEGAVREFLRSPFRWFQRLQ